MLDTARDILVGKVPDPKSQVEQITIALIYKFMDDMDAEAEELGGKWVQSIVQMRYVAAFAALNNHRESRPPVTTGGYSLPPHTRLKIVNWLSN